MILGRKEIIFFIFIPLCLAITAAFIIGWIAGYGNGFTSAIHEGLEILRTKDITQILAGLRGQRTDNVASAVNLTFTAP